MASHAGTKRAHSSTNTAQGPRSKRQRVHLRTHNVQKLPHGIEPAPQDPVFAQGQLLRSITSALKMAGFDSVLPTALEMFRALAEEYMLQLSSYVKIAMEHSRRTQPTVLDFESALSLVPNTRTASLLQPQLSLRLPKAITAPAVAPPDSAEAPAPDFSALLAPLISARPPLYIPRHFPKLPSSHTWMSTPDYPTREMDSRKMREKATREGQLAEQALRRLAAAAKHGAVKEEQKRRQRSHDALSGPGKPRANVVKNRRGGEDTVLKDELYGGVLREIGGFEHVDDGIVDARVEASGDGQQRGVDLGMPEGVVVNHNMQHWRKGRSRRALAL